MGASATVVVGQRLPADFFGEGLLVVGLETAEIYHFTIFKAQAFIIALFFFPEWQADGSWSLVADDGVSVYVRL